jgi:1-acyl-sn-glycerol-3-phosphate acyltransferase
VPRAKARLGETGGMTSSFAAARRVALYIGLTLSLIPVQLLLVALRHPCARRLPRPYHRLCCRILGFRIETIGAPSPGRPTLFVANHTSYVDIIALGSQLDVSFIAKGEIARWPFFGWLAKLQRTIFIDRRGFKAAAQRDRIHARLSDGDDLVLFPEGTSNDGVRVRPFKTALFAVAQDTVRGRPLVVQPVSIAYTRLDGLPLGRALRPYVAWYGDMTLVPHLWTMLGLGTLTVSVAFHEPVEGTAFPSRKALAEHCFAVISTGVEGLNRGRPVAPPPAVAAADAPAGVRVDAPAPAATGEAAAGAQP